MSLLWPLIGNGVMALVHPVDKSTGVSSDQTGILTSLESASTCPYPLRRVSYRDPETGKRLKFLNNNFTLSAIAIVEMYKQRRLVKLFFKWSSSISASRPFLLPPRTPSRATYALTSK